MLEGFSILPARAGSVSVFQFIAENGDVRFGGAKGIAGALGADFRAHIAEGEIGCAEHEEESQDDGQGDGDIAALPLAFRLDGGSCRRDRARAGEYPVGRLELVEIGEEVSQQ